MSIFEDGNRLSSQSLVALNEHADMIECQCPSRLIDVLKQVRNFGEYTKSCIEKFPQDASTHEWLFQSAQNLDSLLSTTIAQLARYEGFIDENNDIVARRKRS